MISTFWPGHVREQGGEEMNRRCCTPPLPALARSCRQYAIVDPVQGSPLITMEILRYLTSPRSSPKSFDDFEARDQDNNQIDVFGSEMVEVDEPVGIFMPRLRRRPQLLQLDQVQNVLHYDNYRKVMCVEDISFVRSVEELDERGNLQWWMSIQDTATIQVWIIHFSSLERLMAWVALLRSFTACTHSRSYIADIVNAKGPSTIKTRSSSITRETILTMSPEE